MKAFSKGLWPLSTTILISIVFTPIVGSIIAAYFFFQSPVDNNTTENDLPATNAEQIKNAMSSPTSAQTNENTLDIEKIVPQAEVSTESWKTCRNEMYGYEFKYPREWYEYGYGMTIDIGDAPGRCDLSGARIFERPFSRDEVGQGDGIEIDVIVVPETETDLNQRSDIKKGVREIRSHFGNSMSDSSLSNAIGEKNFILVTEQVQNEPESKKINIYSAYSINKGKVYRVYVQNGFGEVWEEFPFDLFETILSTFKFIN
jgi:phosphate/sulfate permease